MAVELPVAYDGSVVNVPTEVWEMFALWSASQLAERLIDVARGRSRTLSEVPAWVEEARRVERPPTARRSDSSRDESNRLKTP
jgi:hypothetical protein